MKRRFQAVKGTRDILPPDSALWNQVEQTARSVFAAYNFQEIRLPVLEQQYLFERSLGHGSDVVSKEMYALEDREPSEFWIWRDVVSGWKRSIDDPEVVAHFEYAVSKFLECLEEELKEGRIPDVGRAENVRDSLRHRVQELQANRKKSIAVRDLKALIETIQLEAALIRGEDLVLRPEATASVCRAYIEHGMHTRPGLAKLYYIGPMFRRERPQKGRFRQFYQIGAEVLGASDHPAIDAEVIELVLVFIERCGLKGATLCLNSIGCQNCRPKYVERLRAELQKVKSKLGPDSQRRIETNPLRVLDSKLEEEQPIIEKLPSILDHLCADCREHFEKVKRELNDREIKFEINRRLVRGLDYYMRTTFEITAPGLGAQNAVCGGGRYDGLVELLGGPPTKGIGWALGTDRFLLALEQTGVSKADTQVSAFLIWLGEPAYARARALARRLREAGASVELPYEEMKLKKALGRADQLAARFAVILGEEELAKGVFTLREMQSGTQRALTEDELVRELTRG